MWENVLLTGVSAIAAGAMAVPAGRSFLLGDVEHDWLAQELDFDCIDPDGKTVCLKSGGMFRVFKIEGVAYDAKPLHQQEQLLALRAALIHVLGDGKCGQRFYGIKRQRDISFGAEWPSPVLTEIGEAERQEFKASSYIEWYLAISANSAKSLVDGTGAMTSMLGVYCPTILVRQDDPEQPCPLTGFLNYLACGDLRKDLPAVSENISGNLPGSDYTVDRQTGLIQTYTPTRHLHQVIAVREWPKDLTGQIIADVLALQGDLEVSQVCVPIDRDQAILMFDRKVKEQSAALIGNPELAAEYAATVQLLSEGNTTVFHTQLHIIARADNENRLSLLLTAIGKILGKRRIKFSVETRGAPICWFNRIPTPTPRLVGSKGLRRPLFLREENIAALWALNHSPTGMMKGPYGNHPVRLLRTPSGQAYAFQFQVLNKPQALGNYLVFAPAGSGKSTLVMHLLGGLAKFADVRSYIFDSKEGARFMVEAMGGIYQGYGDLQLNPLDVGEDTLENRKRIDFLLRAMAADATPSDAEDEIFNHAIECAFTTDTPDRTLNAIYELAFPRRTPLRRAFARWVTNEKGNAGLHSHIFNAPHDSLGSLLNASHMVGINMNEALDDPVLGPPIVGHISQAIYRSAANASKGFNIFIDEAAKLLQNEGFKALAMEMYREYRKLNGAVGMAFQDPAALFNSGAAEAFLENTATLFFFPNSLATRASLEPFNLNEEQIGFILGGEYYERKAGQRLVLVVKRDAATGFDESAILDVDLTPLGDCTRLYRAGTDANKDLAALKTQWGDAWQAHL